MHSRGSTRQWLGMRSQHAWLSPHDDETVTGPGQVGVAFSAHSNVRWQSDGVTRSASYPGGSVIVSGSTPIVWSHVRETTEALEIYPDEALLSSLSGASPASGRVFFEAPRVGIADPVVLGVASVLRRAHATGGTLGDVASSSLAHLLAGHVLRRYGGVAVEPRPRVTRLPARALASVHELVEGELGTTLTIDRLARVTHFSPFHFARAFKATVGMAPHEFVTSRRIDRARLLLIASGEPVARVAARVGFQNLSHFRRVFRSHTGLLPSELRAIVAAA